MLTKTDRQEAENEIVAISHVEVITIVYFQKQPVTTIMNISLTHFHKPDTPAPFHTHIGLETLTSLLRPIWCVHIWQCSIKIPSDKRFKWLPL